MRLFHPWGREPRLWRSMSHVVGHGHLLTSSWVPLGPIRARRGPIWVRILGLHRSGSSSLPSGLVWGHRTISAEIEVPSGFRQNPDLVRQAPSGPDGSLHCPVSSHY